jgi:hypothetical protein
MNAIASSRAEAIRGILETGAAFDASYDQQMDVGPTLV